MMLEAAWNSYYQNKLEQAENLCNKHLKQYPDDPLTLLLIAKIAFKSHQYKRATQALEQALNSDRFNPEIFNLLGVIYETQYLNHQAVGVYRESLRLDFDQIDIHMKSGQLLVQFQEEALAFKHFQEVIRLAPDWAEPYNYLGNIFRNQGELFAAQQCYQQAITLNPSLNHYYYNLGNIHLDLWQCEKAIEQYLSALDYHSSPQIYNDLGNAKLKQGYASEALNYYQHAHKQDPNYYPALSNYLYCLNFIPELTPSQLRDTHVTITGQLEVQTTPFQSYDNDPSPERRLRIGYISADFHNHAAAYLIEALLNQVNAKDFEIICFSNQPIEDQSSEHFQKLSDHWVQVKHFSDEQLAVLIHQEQIDILVDPGAGFTANNRLPVFAYRPAPIQLTFYPGEIGFQSIQRITDHWIKPKAENDLNKLVYLEKIAVCFPPPGYAPDLQTPPMTQNGHITFGSFNNPAKLNPVVCQVWAEILTNVPHSVLLLKNRAYEDLSTQQRIQELFQKYAIDPARIIFKTYQNDYSDHLNHYNSIDIGLDPFPYNGHVTSCEALWMGVPVITLECPQDFGKASSAFLKTIECEELIAQSTEEYINIAMKLAGDQRKVTELKQNLRETMKESSLCHQKNYIQRVEGLYRQLWKEYCSRPLKHTRLFSNAYACYEKGQLFQAEYLCKVALKKKTKTAQWQYLKGLIKYQNHHLNDALIALQESLKMDKTANVLAYLGLTYQEQNNLSEAQKYFAQALQLNPDSPEIHCYSANFFLKKNQTEAAKNHYLDALALDSNNIEALFNLGNLYKSQKQYTQALKYWKQGLNTQSNFLPFHLAIGEIYEEQYPLNKAQEFYLQSLEVLNHEKLHQRLAETYTKLRQPQKAIEHSLKALQLSPLNPDILNQLGLILRQSGYSTEALPYLKQATYLVPTDAVSNFNLALTYQDLSEAKPSIEHFEIAYQYSQKDRALIRAATVLPAIYQSSEEIIEWREHFSQKVEDLSQKTLKITDPVIEALNPNFLLAYQGFNDRDLQEKFANLFQTILPTQIHELPEIPTQNKIRIGFVSRYFYHHSILHVFEQLIQECYSHFEVFIFSIGHTQADEKTHQIKEQATEFIELPYDLEQSRQMIASHELHILVYTDIGMEPFSYFLAFTRLASIQCVLSGHPVTTGISSIDYFISSQALEIHANQAQNHYSEKLILLKEPVVGYSKPIIQTSSNQPFNLSKQNNHYVCPMSLFKVHPDFDKLIDGILKHDPRGILYFFEYGPFKLEEQLLQRFEKTLPGLSERIQFLPWLPQNEFIQFLSQADVILDTHHFGAGNTAYLSLATGTPIITWPSEFLRSRSTQMLYGLMNMDTFIAHSRDEYIQKSLNTAQDKNFQQEARQEILQKNSQIFNKKQGISELINFFNELCH